jgi:hypothetical protein
MSEKMVAKAVRNEMASSLGPDLMAALRNELGDERRLDDFTYNPLLKGETFACGPELVGGIVSSNIPALPHLTVMRSLLVKAPCIVKTASSEPYFLPQYAQTLWEIDPAVARAVAVVSFGRAERPLLEAFPPACAPSCMGTSWDSGCSPARRSPARGWPASPVPRPSTWSSTTRRPASPRMCSSWRRRGAAPP